jgi:hypothetical protein
MNEELQLEILVCLLLFVLIYNGGGESVRWMHSFYFSSPFFLLA